MTDDSMTLYKAEKLSIVVARVRKQTLYEHCFFILSLRERVRGGSDLVQNLSSTKRSLARHILFQMYCTLIYDSILNLYCNTLRTNCSSSNFILDTPFRTKVTIQEAFVSDF